MSPPVVWWTQPRSSRSSNRVEASPHPVHTELRHVRLEKQWWVENRTYTEVFADEFEEALRILAILPGAGPVYPQADVPGLRRIHLRKVGCHVYHKPQRRACGTRCGMSRLDGKVASINSVRVGLTM